MHKNEKQKNLRYITVTADFENTGITEPEDPLVSPNELGLSEHLTNKLRSWVQSYQEIIPMSIEERKENADKISLLDKKGIEIAKEILSEVKDVRVRYYSEGLLNYIELPN